jgi:hypothetical protein
MVIGDALSDDDEEKERIDERLSMSITTTGGAFELLTAPGRADGRVVRQLLAYEDDFYRSEGLSLEKPMSLNVYAIGEYFRSDKVFVDYAWMIDADTREKVWIMERWNTDPAGGARKNRFFDGSVSLPAGNYVLYCSTDDSHSPEEWNAAPPYDPDHWGVTILVDDPSLAASVKPYDDSRSKKEILAMTRMGDDEYDVRYFTVEQPVEVHIFAIGEYGYDDDFADYGWIEDMNTLDHVWEMEWRNTDHAGGAAKNRQFDGIVELDPGDYAVYYVTDGSHSFRRWNAPAPADRDRYGISIYGVGEDFDESGITLLRDRERGNNVLATITAVGDDEEHSDYFTLEKPTELRIYAIGEGIDHEMYDYAWIEDANSGDVVWEMTYRRTSHAGGAKKNRMVDAVIRLQKGVYEVYYITDGSHSFSDWNDKKPRDPVHWGVTITVAE